MSNIKSFTLIELLIVIAIIGILSGILILSLSNSTDSAYEAKAEAELSQITKALLVYKTNHGSYPIANCTLSNCPDLTNTIPNLPLRDDITYQSDGTFFTTRASLASATFESTSTNPQVVKLETTLPIPTVSVSVDNANPEAGTTVNLSSTIANIDTPTYSWDCGSGEISTLSTASLDTTALGGTTVTCTLTVSLYTDSVSISVAVPTIYTSCKNILDNSASAGDGVYTIDPDGDGIDSFSVYCDMTTDGGGWTLVWKSNQAMPAMKSAEVNVSALQNLTLDTFAKLSDNIINQIKYSSADLTIAYRVVQTSPTCSTDQIAYFDGACVWNSEQASSNLPEECKRGKNTFDGEWRYDNYGGYPTTWCMGNGAFPRGIFCFHDGASYYGGLHGNYYGYCNHCFASTLAWVK